MDFSLSDYLKSCIIIDRNFLYKGCTVDRSSYYALTSGHQVSVERPNKSWSIHEVNFYTNSVAKRGCSFKLLKKRTQLFWHKTYKLQVLDTKYRTLARVFTGVVRNAHLSIFRRNISARTKLAVPPCNCMRAGPRHPNIVLPYNKQVTASAYTNYTLTRLLHRPNNLAWHLMLLNAAIALHMRFSKIVVGLVLALFIIKPKYLN